MLCQILIRAVLPHIPPVRLTSPVSSVPLPLSVLCCSDLPPPLCLWGVSGGELEAPRDGRAGAGAARHRVGVQGHRHARTARTVRRDTGYVSEKSMVTSARH